jgi:hypothetical protein
MLSISSFGGCCLKSFFCAIAQPILFSQINRAFLNGAFKFCGRGMANQTKKVKEISAGNLQKLTKQYAVTKSGSKKQIALRLWKLRMHVMTREHLKTIEDFLQLAAAKRYKGPRYGTRKNGSLYQTGS